MKKKQNLADRKVDQNRATCIFCPNPIDGSDEHIIPKSLNGRLHSKGIICCDCNQFFGEKLDPVLKKALFMQLHLFGFDSAQAFLVKDEKGNPYIVDQKGTMKQVGIEVSKIQQNGHKGISVSGPPIEAAKALIKKMIRTYGKEETLYAVTSGQIGFSERQVVPDTLLGENPLRATPRLLLALEKIVVEYYAYCGLETSLLTKRLERIIALDERDPEMTLCNFNQEVRMPGTEETSHLLVIRSRSESNQVIAYIELFNVLCAYTVLIENYQGPELNFVFHQDVVTSIRTEPKIVLNFDYIKKVTPDFQLLSNQLIERKSDREVMKYINDELDEYVSSLSTKLEAREITAEEHDKMIWDYGINLTAYMTLHYPDRFSGLGEDSLKRSNFLHSYIYTTGISDFEKHYMALMGIDIKFNGDSREWTMKRFHSVPAPPRDGRERRKVYCHFVSKRGGHEKEIPCFDIFKALQLAFPKEETWL